MGALQPGLPSPSAIPRGYNIVIIDLQDCFFSIPLYPPDCQRFAFSIPSENFKQPYQRYQWKVLPQGMKNSPTLCQKFVDTALQTVRQNFPEVYLIHYMDDILIAHLDRKVLQTVLTVTVLTLKEFGLQIAPEKIQTEPPFSYLGRTLQTSFYTHQPLELRRDHLQTLNDFQKLLGDINWIRPLLKLTTADLKPLFNVLQGNSDPTSPRNLTPEAAEALTVVEKHINTATLQYLNYSLPWSFVVLPTCVTPTGCLWQDGVLEWIHLPQHQKRLLHIILLLQHF